MGACLKLAWRQLVREKKRFAVALAGVAFAVVLMLMQLGFRSALFASAVRFHDAFRADVFLINPKSAFLTTMKSFPKRRVEQALGHPGVASVSAAYLGLGVWQNPEAPVTHGILLVGFDPTDPAFDLPDVNAQLAALRIPDNVLFDSASRPEYGPIAKRIEEGKRGMEVEVNDKRLRVAGLFRLGTSFGVDGTVVMSEATFLRTYPGRAPGLVEVGLIRLAPGADANAVKGELERALPKDVEVLTKEQYRQREIHYWDTVTPIGWVLGFGVLFGFGIGAIIVSQILFADVSQHLPEYATLKAIGYSDRFLYGVVVCEALVLAVLGYAPGVLITLGLYDVAAKATLLPLALVPQSGAIVFALTVTMCCAAGGMALREVRTADPAEVF